MFLSSSRFRHPAYYRLEYGRRRRGHGHVNSDSHGDGYTNADGAGIRVDASGCVIMDSSVLNNGTPTYGGGGIYATAAANGTPYVERHTTSPGAFGAA